MHRSFVDRAGYNLPAIDSTDEVAFGQLAGHVEWIIKNALKK